MQLATQPAPGRDNDPLPLQPQAAFDQLRALRGQRVQIVAQDAGGRTYVAFAELTDRGGPTTIATGADYRSRPGSNTTLLDELKQNEAALAALPETARTAITSGEASFRNISNIRLQRGQIMIAGMPGPVNVLSISPLNLEAAPAPAANPANPAAAPERRAIADRAEYEIVRIGPDRTISTRTDGRWTPTDERYRGPGVIPQGGAYAIRVRVPENHPLAPAEAAQRQQFILLDNDHMAPVSVGAPEWRQRGERWEAVRPVTARDNGGRELRSYIRLNESGDPTEYVSRRSVTTAITIPLAPTPEHQARPIAIASDSPIYSRGVRAAIQFGANESDRFGISDVIDTSGRLTHRVERINIDAQPTMQGREHRLGFAVSFRRTDNGQAAQERGYLVLNEAGEVTGAHFRGQSYTVEEMRRTMRSDPEVVNAGVVHAAVPANRVPAIVPDRHPPGNTPALTGAFGWITTTNDPMGRFVIPNDIGGWQVSAVAARDREGDLPAGVHARNQYAVRLTPGAAPVDALGYTVTLQREVEGQTQTRTVPLYVRLSATGEPNGVWFEGTVFDSASIATRYESARTAAGTALVTRAQGPEEGRPQLPSLVLSLYGARPDVPWPALPEDQVANLSQLGITNPGAPAQGIDGVTTSYQARAMPHGQIVVRQMFTRGAGDQLVFTDRYFSWNPVDAATTQNYTPIVMRAQGGRLVAVPTAELERFNANIGRLLRREPLQE